MTYFGVLFFAGTAQQYAQPFTPHTLLHLWQRLDTNWYLKIAQYGYWRPGPATAAIDYQGQMPTAFFPLYPMLIHAVTFVVGPSHSLVAALIVSNLGTLAGFIGLGLFAAHEAGPGAAARTIALCAAYPLAFFMAAGYTEGLFLACAAFALLFARQGRWHWAALAAFLAGLTRFTGIILVLPLLWEYGRQHAWLRRAWPPVSRWRELLIAGAVAGAPLIAIGMYSAYLWVKFGDPLSFVHAAQNNWGHTSLPLWVSLPTALRTLHHTPAWTYEQAYLLVDFVPIAVFGIASLAMLALRRRVPFTYTLYMLGLVYVSVMSPTNWSPDLYTSAGRYLIPAIPVYVLASRWTKRWPWLETLALSAGFALQGAVVALWLGGNLYII